MDDSSKKTLSDPDEQPCSSGRSASPSLHCRMRMRQEAKLKELRQALIDEGYRSLDQQAAVLGLGRSTAWVILQNHHKFSGLRAATLNRMLRSEELPPAVRRILEAYIQEKSAGAYGHSAASVRDFRSKIDKLGMWHRAKDRT